MYRRVEFQEFHDTFKTSRYYKNAFSYDGLELLYDYLEALEEDIGEPIEFDMVSLVGDFREYTTENLIKEFSGQLTLAEKDGLTDEEIIEKLKDKDIIDVVASNGDIHIIRSGY